MWTFKKWISIWIFNAFFSSDEHRDFAEEIERLKKLRGKSNRQRRQPADPTFKD